MDARSDVLLFSGGLDSTALAFQSDALLLTVDYGQKTAEAEKAAAKRIASELKRTHEIIEISSSQLAERVNFRFSEDVPVEWWSYRNQLLITLGATLAVMTGRTHIVIGTVREDAQYADGRADFIGQLDGLLTSQEGHVRLVAPALELSSAELLKRSGLPQELAMLTQSCSQSDLACGACDSCEKTREVLSSVYGL